MGKRLYVGNLPYTTTEDELRAAFAPHGAVTEARIVMDRDTQRPRGFAFVEMESQHAAEVAQQAMDGATLGGRTLTVNPANDRPQQDRGGRRDRHTTEGHMAITKQQLWDFLKRAGACKEALAWLRNTDGTLDELWLACRWEWGSWLLDLARISAADRLAPLYADYEAKRAPLDADYEAKRAPLYADYQAKRAPLDADYQAKLAPLYADYEAMLAPLYADYQAKLAPLYADYEAKRAPLDADYQAKLAPLDADYQAKLAPLDADYQAKRAQPIPWSMVEKALVDRLDLGKAAA